MQPCTISNWPCLFRLFFFNEWILHFWIASSFALSLLEDFPSSVHLFHVCIVLSNLLLTCCPCVWLCHKECKLQLHFSCASYLTRVLPIVLVVASHSLCFLLGSSILWTIFCTLGETLAKQTPGNLFSECSPFSLERKIIQDKIRTVGFS